MPVFSDGLIVDTTPPEPKKHILVGENLIKNPSFEGTEESDNIGGSTMFYIQLLLQIS